MAEGWKPDERVGGNEMYLCPVCNTRVSPTAKECPNCHAVFVDAGEEAPPPPKPSENVTYKCPNCDSTVSERDTKCPNCGAMFVDAAEAAPQPQPARAPPAPPAEGPASAAPPQTRPPAEAPGPPGTPKAPGAPRSGKMVKKGKGGAVLSVPRPSFKRRVPQARAVEARKRKHSKAVELLSVRKKRIAQRRMLGLVSMAGGMGIYLLTLLLTAGKQMTIVPGLSIAVGIVFLVLGVLITYNQWLAQLHYQEQLAKARVEAALLREISKERSQVQSPPASPARAPVAPARAAPAAAPASTRTWGEEAEAEASSPAPSSPAARTAFPVPEGLLSQGPAPTSGITVEVAPSGPDDKDKVACANCGYMNRRIFVRCIRCGTELAKREQSISVETFERPEPMEESPSKAGSRQGAPVPWEAKHAQTPTSKAAARAAERKAALEEAEAAAAEKGADRRAVIGVAANFSKLPREMREQLIRTLYKIDDPVVRQDVVSAIAENYTEVPRDIQDSLMDLGDDEDPRVREEVAFEVNRNFDRIPLDVVQSIFGKLAGDPERMVREDVVSAIAENFTRLPKESQDLLKLLAQDKVESVRDEVSFEIAKNSDVIPEKFKSEVMELLKRAGGAVR